MFCAIKIKIHTHTLYIYILKTDVWMNPGFWMVLVKVNYLLFSNFCRLCYCGTFRINILTLVQFLFVLIFSFLRRSSRNFIESRYCLCETDCSFLYFLISSQSVVVNLMPCVCTSLTIKRTCSICHLRLTLAFGNVKIAAAEDMLVFIWSHAFCLQVEFDYQVWISWSLQYNLFEGHSGLFEERTVVDSFCCDCPLNIHVILIWSLHKSSTTALRSSGSEDKLCTGPIIRRAQQLLMCQCCCCCDAETDVSLWQTQASVCAEKYICKQAMTWRFMPHIPNYFILLVVCIHQAVCLYCAPVRHVLPQTSLVWVWN